MISDSAKEAATALWTVEFPRARTTSWHQSYKELIVHVGQALGIAMAFSHSKDAPVNLDIKITSHSVRVWARSGDEEHVVLDAHRETVN